MQVKTNGEYWGHDTVCGKGENIIEAEKAILQSLIAKLPKEKEEGKLTECGCCGDAQFDEAISWNACLSQVKAMLMEKEKCQQ